MSLVFWYFSPTKVYGSITAWNIGMCVYLYVLDKRSTLRCCLATLCFHSSTHLDCHGASYFLTYQYSTAWSVHGDTDWYLRWPSDPYRDQHSYTLDIRIGKYEIPLSSYSQQTFNITVTIIFHCHTHAHAHAHTRTHTHTHTHWGRFKTVNHSDAHVLEWLKTWMEGKIIDQLHKRFSSSVVGWRGKDTGGTRGVGVGKIWGSGKDMGVGWGYGGRGRIWVYGEDKGACTYLSFTSSPVEDIYLRGDVPWRRLTLRCLLKSCLATHTCLLKAKHYCVTKFCLFSLRLRTENNGLFVFVFVCR